MRHAKSDWNVATSGDHGRPLAPRGIKAAQATGRWLAERGLNPDHAVTSSATRAQSTLEHAVEAGGWTCSVSVQDSLYHGGVADILDIVRASPVERTSILLVGHQPTWSAAVGTLIGGGIVRMPTAAVASILIHDEWAALEPGSGELQFLIKPKILA